MKQKILTPPISDCWCGEKAKLMEDWDFRNTYRVECRNNHHLTKFCATKNRAIHRWNNRVLKRLE